MAMWTKTLQKNTVTKMVTAKVGSALFDKLHGIDMSIVKRV